MEKYIVFIVKPAALIGSLNSDYILLTISIVNSIQTCNEDVNLLFWYGNRYLFILLDKI